MLDQIEEFGAVVAALACELDQLDRLGGECAALWRAGDTDAVAGSRFE
jgi:hypothetical protein